MSPEITPTLIYSLKEGHTEAWSTLYDLYAAALYGIILKHICEKSAILVLEKSFLYMFKEIQSYDHEKERLFTWMYKQTLHVCGDITSTVKGGGNKATIKKLASQH